MCSRWRAALLAGTALAALAIPSAAQAVDGMEVLTGLASGYSSVWGMSRNGRFIFGAADGGFGNFRGWIYSNGTYTLVPVFADPTLQTSISAINDTGTVWVGYGQFQGPTYPIGHAIRYENGGFTDLHTGAAFGPGGSLQNYSESFATALSADTTIVAGFATNDLGNRQAFRWTQATGMTGLGFLPGYSWSNANAISADGTTIVGYVANPTGVFDSQPMYWTAATGIVGLGFLPGGTHVYGGSSANAVSANGSVIVGNAVADSAGNQHAFAGHRPPACRISARCPAAAIPTQLPSAPTAPSSQAALRALAAEILDLHFDGRRPLACKNCPISWPREA